MASVTSLDKDLKNLRLSRYTPQAANEVRGWIEEVLRESLPSGDLLEALKDGVVLCRLLNLAVGSPGVKYKASKMPFVQMENISHFLHACQMAPLNLQPHDVFLTVDLYESKDPAQVLQCLVAFSRRANALEPAKFPRAIGKVKSGFVSPQLSGSSQGGFKGMTSYNRMSGISSITERQRGIEEQQAREEEEQRWEEETRKLREKERIAAEEEKKRWADEQRQWEEEDRRRQLEEREAEEKLEKERQRKRELADSRLNGQFLSQYQASQRLERGSSPGESMPTPERERIQALERELELAKQRERQYERERQEFSRSRQVSNTSQVSQTSATRGRALPPKPAKPSFDLTSQEEERRLLRSEWQANQDNRLEQIEPSPPPPSLPPRSLPEPPLSPRPLPDPSNYPKTRTDRFLATNPAPQPTQPTSHRPFEFSTEREVDEENHRRIASTQKTRAGGWASKSLLEREMERERERQREWEENQKRTTDAVKQGVNSAGTGPGEGGWDVNQYGYIGGDNQNRGATGIGFGARRQIIGPRPPR
ncbi:calponin [Ophidiomyces ophidiicola]|nr:calponin [Ophidiomyces ophidiicola]